MGDLESISSNNKDRHTTLCCRPLENRDQGCLPENSFPVRSREIFRFPGNFREFFIYCGGTNSSISRFFKYFSFGLDQALVSKKIVSKLKIIVIRQKNAFSLKNGMFLIFYIVSFQFPGIPGNFPEKFGNSRFPGNEIVREIDSPRTDCMLSSLH